MSSKSKYKWLLQEEQARHFNHSTNQTRQEEKTASEVVLSGTTILTLSMSRLPVRYVTVFKSLLYAPFIKIVEASRLFPCLPEE